MAAEFNEAGFQRRVIGLHDIRLDGILDLTIRAKGCSVLDLGCNRGLVAFEMANNGAAVCHGVDNYEGGIRTAQEIFADLRNVESRFEVADLTRGAESLAPFGDVRWDIVLCLATYHKIKRAMEPAALSQFMQHLGNRTKHFFGWRGPRKDDESNEEIIQLDRDMADAGLRRVHTSYLSKQIGPAAIWERR